VSAFADSVYKEKLLSELKVLFSILLGMCAAEIITMVVCNINLRLEQYRNYIKKSVKISLSYSQI